MESEDSPMEIPEGLFDLHICGMCRAEFNDVDIFMQHKKQCPALVKVLASIQDKKRKQLQQEQLKQKEQRVEHTSLFQSSMSLSLTSKQAYQRGHISVDASSLSSASDHTQQLQHVILEQVSGQPQYATSLLQQGHSGAQQLLLQTHCEEVESDKDSDFHRPFGSPSAKHHETQYKGTSDAVHIQGTQDGKQRRSMSSKHDTGPDHEEHVLMQSQPPRGVAASVENVTGVSGLSEISISLLPQRPEELVFSKTEVTQSQQQVLNDTEIISPHLGAVQLRNVQSSSGHLPHRRKIPRAHHTVVVSHNPAPQSEQASLLNAVSETIMEADLQSHSQGDGNHAQTVNYQFDQQLDKYVLDQTHVLTHTHPVDSEAQLSLQRLQGHLEMPVSTGEALNTRITHSDLTVPLPEVHVLRQTEQEDEVMLGQEASGQLVDPELEDSMMELEEDSVFEQDYSLIPDRPLQGSISGGITINVAAERRRRHTVADTGVSNTSLSAPSPNKRHHREQQEHIHHQHQLQQLQNKWRHKLSEMAAELAVDHNPDPSLSKDIVEATATLQDLAAEASELAESLPDNLANSHLIAVHPQASHTILEATQDLMVPQPSQLHPGISGIRSPEVKLIAAASARTLSKRKSAHRVRPVDEGLHMPGMPEIRPADKKPSQAELITSTIKRKVFKCDNCSYETTYFKDLHRHRRTHTGERPFVCPHCDKNFNRSDKLRVHIRWHTGDKPFKCKLCDYASIDSSSLKKHIRTHTDERPFKCQVCTYASRNSSQLIVHLRTHTGDSPFECKTCHSKFKINSDLKRHMRVHTGEKPYQCEICDYKCSIKGNLKSHYRINHCPEKQLQCTSCEFTSSSQKLLKEHMKQHTSGHVCPKCQYICSTTSSLKNHLRTHSDEKPFHCDFCPYSAKQRGNVKAHIKKRHADKLRSSRRHGRSKGSSSKRGSESGRIVVKDEDRRHEGSGGSRSIRAVCKKSYPCGLCRASFVKEHSLRCHLRQHSTDPGVDSKTILQQLQAGHSASGGSDTVYKVSTVQPPAGLYIQLETEPPTSSRSAASKTSGYTIVASQDPAPSSRRQGSLSQRCGPASSLDQIVDAAARLYEEQYDVQTQTSDGQEKGQGGCVTHNSQHVQIVQVPVGFGAVQYPDGTIVENLIPAEGMHDSDTVTILSQDGIKTDLEDDSKPPVYVENIILSDGTHMFSSDGSLSNLVIGNQASQQLTSGSFIPSSRSPQMTASSSGKVVTYLSPNTAPAKSAASQCVTVLEHSAVESQLQRQSSNASFVTYTHPASLAATSQELVASSAQHQQQQQVFTSVGGQHITLLQQPETKEIQFVQMPYSPNSVAFSQISPTSLPAGIVSVASATSQRFVSAAASPSPTSSSARRPSRSRPRAIKPLVDLMPAPALPVMQSLSQQLQGGSIVSSIVTVAGSTMTSAVASSNQNIGGLTTFQLSGPISSSRPQAMTLRQQPTVQYQILSQPQQQQQQTQQVIVQQPQQQQQQTQQVIVQQPQQQQQQTQQVIVQQPQQQQQQTQQVTVQQPQHQHQPQHQYLLQDQQQTIHLQQAELPINVQVIQQDSLQQHHQQAQTFPINIIAPVNFQQPPPPPPPQQPTQIQIILPQTSFPNQPAAINTGIGTAQPQQQIILQVQDPTPPPPPPPPQTMMTMQETPVQAVMQGGRVVSLPPSLLQSILAQLQGGAGGVSLSGGDSAGTAVGESPVHVQEVVIHMDPQQLSQTLVLKNEEI